MNMYSVVTETGDHRATITKRNMHDALDTATDLMHWVLDSDVADTRICVYEIGIEGSSLIANIEV